MSAGSETNPLTLLKLLRRVAPGLFTQAALHTRLLQVEWEMEKNRWQVMAGLVMIGFSCFLCALMFTGALVAAYFWPTEYRLWALLGVSLFFILACVLVLYVLKVYAAKGAHAFAACREELSADIALIKSRV